MESSNQSKRKTIKAKGKINKSKKQKIKKKSNKNKKAKTVSNKNEEQKATTAITGALLLLRSVSYSGMS